MLHKKLILGQIIGAFADDLLLFVGKTVGVLTRAPRNAIDLQAACLERIPDYFQRIRSDVRLGSFK